jgi:hypothetical protein
MPTKAGANMNLWSGYTAKQLEKKIKQGHTTAIEVKLSDANLAKNFTPFLTELQNVEKIQLVKNLEKEKMYPNGVEVRKAASWLCHWKISLYFLWSG